MGILSTEQSQSLLDEVGNLLTTEVFDPGGVLVTEASAALLTEDGQDLTTEVYIPYSGSALSTEVDAILLAEDGQELVTEDFVAADGTLLGSVFQPDLTVTTTVEVTYTTSWLEQPATTTTFEARTTYAPPPSTGGQPSVVSRFRSVVSVGATYPAYAVEGLATLTYETAGRAELIIPPLPPVEAVVNPEELQDIMVVSVTMPTPTTYDRFGRPTG